MATATGARQAPRDLTTGPITWTLLLFSLPTLGANILQSLNGSINTVWIGRFLGEAAIAATTSANIVMFLMFSLGFGFSMATTILIGQSMGLRDVVGARRALGTGIGLFTIVSVLIATAGWFSADTLLRLMATPGAARPLALAYLKVIFLGVPPMFLSLLITSSLRAVGDAITPLRIMILNVVIDAGLNPVLIQGLGPAPKMGVAGAATATLIANYAVLIGAVSYVYWKDIAIRLRGPEFRFLIPDPALLKVIAVKGLPMGLQMLMMTLSGLVMVGLINRAGVDVAAAYGVDTLLWTYVQMPAMAIGAAVSAMVAQNIGAGLWNRVDAITRAGLVVNFLLTGSVVLLLLLFDRPAFTLFVGADSPVIPIARHIQFIASWSFILFGMTFVISATVRANGAVYVPLVILTLGLFMGRIGFAWVLMPIHQDFLWWSFPFGSGLTLLMSWLYYRYGNWRRGGMVARMVQAEAAKEAVA